MSSRGGPSGPRPHVGPSQGRIEGCATRITQIYPSRPQRVAKLVEMRLGHVIVLAFFVVMFLVAVRQDRPMETALPVALAAAVVTTLGGIAILCRQKAVAEVAQSAAFNGIEPCR